MLHYLKDYCNYVEITGFGNVDFARAERFLKDNRKSINPDFEVQFFDAQVVASEEHLLFAVANALQAFHYGRNASKSLAMETMLYASGQRQIQKAILRCGIRVETTRMAVLVIGEDPSIIKTAVVSIGEAIGAIPDENVLSMTSAKLKRIVEVFDISEEEILAVIKNEDRTAAVVSLVIEQVALLSVQF